MSASEALSERARRWEGLCEGAPAIAGSLMGRLSAQNDAQGLRELLALPSAQSIEPRAIDEWAQACLCARRWDAAAALLERPGRSLSALSLAMVCALTLDHPGLLAASAAGLLEWGAEGREAGREAVESSREIASLDLHYSDEENQLSRERVQGALARFESALLSAAHPSAAPAERRPAL